MSDTSTLSDASFPLPLPLIWSSGANICPPRGAYLEVPSAYPSCSEDFAITTNTTTRTRYAPFRRLWCWHGSASPSRAHSTAPSDRSRYQAQHATLDLVVALVLLGLYGLFLLYSLRTHPEVFAELSPPAPLDEAADHPSIRRGIATLLIASLGAAWMSEILVGAAEEAGRSLGMSQMFIGVVLLALIGGAAELGSAITMGRANRVDLSVGIALGSCVQIALFVAPILVLAAPLVGQPKFQLVFTQAEMWMLFGAVLLGATVATTGRSNWFKGAQLLALYLIVATALYLLPSPSP